MQFLVETLEYGADPDMICCNRKKTARQLRPEWFRQVPEHPETLAEILNR